MNRISLVAILSLLVGVCAYAQSPLQVDPETAAQHLVDHPDPVYPAIARAAYISGVVTTQVLIDSQGHVVYVLPISGPGMLIEAARGAIKRYTYVPFQQNGKPVDATTIVGVGFASNGSFSAVNKAPEDADSKRTFEFFGIYMECDRQVVENTVSGDQVKTCQEAVRQAGLFPSNMHVQQRRSVYVDYATALIRDGKASQAVDAGNAAIAIATQDPNHPAGVSAAYAVVGEALAAAGNLIEADKNLVVAENYERKALHSYVPHPLKEQYSQFLKEILQLHAKVLAALGNQNEAQKKLKEAATL